MNSARGSCSIDGCKLVILKQLSPKVPADTHSTLTFALVIMSCQLVYSRFWMYRRICTMTQMNSKHMSNVSFVFQYTSHRCEEK